MSSFRKSCFPRFEPGRPGVVSVFADVADADGTTTVLAVEDVAEMSGMWSFQTRRSMRELEVGAAFSSRGGPSMLGTQRLRVPLAG